MEGFESVSLWTASVDVCKHLCLSGAAEVLAKVHLCVCVCVCKLQQKKRGFCVFCYDGQAERQLLLVMDRRRNCHLSNDTNEKPRSKKNKNRVECG
jgi:hypothetical protein